jgi:hypothetical protein
MISDNTYLEQNVLWRQTNAEEACICFSYIYTTI